MKGPIDLLQALPLSGLGWDMIAGRWDGQHCPNCGSETWLLLAAGQARCLACRVKWETVETR